MKSKAHGVQEEVVRRSIVQACWGLVALIVLQYVVAFVWWGTHNSSDPLQTTHPFTWDAKVNFSDLTDYYPKLGPRRIRTAYLTGSDWPVFNYAPSAALVYRAFLGFQRSVQLFLFLVIVSTILLLICYAIYLAKRAPDVDARVAAIVAASVTTILSYPMEYTLWRGNLEGIAWIAFSWGLVAFVWRRHSLASCLWALGICVKPFPILLFILLVRRRQYASIVLGAFIFLTLQVLGMLAIAPSLAQAARFTRDGFALYKNYYVYYFRFNESRFQHSLLDSMKATWALLFNNGTTLGPLTYPKSHTNLALHLVWEVILSVSGCVIVAAFWRKSYMNQFFAIVCVCLLFAPVSADYTTILLHLCFGTMLLWLVTDVVKGAMALSRKQLHALFVPFAILFAPQNWLSYYAGILHTTAIVALLIAAALIDMRSTLFGDQLPAGV